jgi:hypothetical protein
MFVACEDGAMGNQLLRLNKGGGWRCLHVLSNLGADDVTDGLLAL